jgi:DNA invertase Pin-like site-specific DNA recombinase
MSTAAAYLRRSVSKDPSKEVSREAQEAACRRMAGPGPLTIYVDWGISGGTAKRPEYQRLRAAVDAGTVTAVYAYSISRLGRNARELLDFLETCKAHRVTVQTEAEGTIGGRGAFADFMLLIMAGLAQLERELASERTLAAVAVRRERGDRLGPAPYGEAEGEDFGAVVAAYRETRSLQATARLLNARGVPTRLGRPWGVSSVRAMLRARAPELLPARKGIRRAVKPYRLAGVLRCPHDDSILAAKTNNGRFPAYVCRKASERPGHPRPFAVSEAFVLAWVLDEVQHFTLDGLDDTAPADAEAQRADLAARLDRANELFIAGAISRDRRDTEAAAVAEAMDALGAPGETVAVGDVDLDGIETWAPADVNRIIRAILARVELGPDMRPVSAVWRNPALRR